MLGLLPLRCPMFTYTFHSLIILIILFSSSKRFSRFRSKSVVYFRFSCDVLFIYSVILSYVILIVM